MTSSPAARLRAEWDRCLGWVAIGAAVVALVAGSAQLSKSPYAAEQVTFLINGGLVSLAILSVGVSALLLADLRDERGKLHRLESLVGGEVTVAAGYTAPATSPVWVLGPAAGVIALFAGWRQASASVRLEDALDGLAPAALGLGIAVAACGWRVLTSWRAVAEHRNRLIAATASQPALATPPGASLTGEWTAPGLGLTHRRDCPSLRYVEDDPHPALDDGALVPCRICHREL